MLFPPARMKIDPLRCMGDWYVQRLVPASNWLEGTAHNGKERYTYDEKTGSVQVKYTFNKGGFHGPVVTTYQQGRVRTENKERFGTSWAVRPYLGFLYIPFYLPFELQYNIIDIDPVDYKFIVCSAPNGSWMYVMTREQEVDDAFLAPALTKLAAVGFDMSKVRKMQQRK